MRATSAILGYTRGVGYPPPPESEFPVLSIHRSRPSSTQGDETPPKLREKEEGFVGGLIAFAKKVGNDWVFNLASFLAYNLLVSVFPLVLGLLAVSNYVIGNISQS